MTQPLAGFFRHTRYKKINSSTAVLWELWLAKQMTSIAQLERHLLDSMVILERSARGSVALIFCHNDTLSASATQSSSANYLCQHRFAPDRVPEKTAVLFLCVALLCWDCDEFLNFVVVAVCCFIFDTRQLGPIKPLDGGSSANDCHDEEEAISNTKCQVLKPEHLSLIGAKIGCWKDAYARSLLPCGQDFFLRCYFRKEALCKCLCKQLP